MPGWALGALGALFLLATAFSAYLVYTTVRDVVAAWDAPAAGGLPVVTGGVVAVAMSIGVVITTLSSFPGDGLVRDALETRVVSGLSEEPPAQVTPPVPPTQSGPLDEITDHPPGSTAEGASKHLDGLRSGLDQMLEKPLGLGLGEAGNWSDAPEAGGESTVGVVAAQLGFPGLLMYVALYLTTIATLVTAAWRRSGPLSDVSLVLAGALFGLFIVSFVSESSLGLLGNAPYFIFTGWVIASVSGSVQGLGVRWVTPDEADVAAGGASP